MDYQSLLEKQASDQGLTLTPLGQMNRRSQSLKVPCCGGVVVRVETESAADSTVCLRDESGTCFCALHGDLCSLYPDVLTAGAVLCFVNITLLVTEGKVPPLLVACLDNLTALMLPDADPAEDAGTPRLYDGPIACGLAAPAATGTGPVPGEGAAHILNSMKKSAPVPVQPVAQQSVPPVPAPPAEPVYSRPLQPTPRQALRNPSATRIKAEVVSDDDEDCLELVDDL